MNNQAEEFLAEGMKRYKQATAVMVSFGKTIETRLQNILSDRTHEQWGNFVPDEAKKTKSTKYWSEYPLFNAKIDGSIATNYICIATGINWYESENEYPFYAVWIEPKGFFQQELREFRWQNRVYLYETDTSYIHGIRLDPDENDFNLKRDFNQLLNELVRFFNEQVK